MTADEALAQHRAFLAEIGEDIVIRRYSGTGPDRPRTEAQVRARVLGYGPKDLVGNIIQGDRQVIAINDPAATVPVGMVALSTLLPLLTTDKAVIRGKEVAVKGVNDNTRRIGGTLVALELQVAG